MCRRYGRYGYIPNITYVYSRLLLLLSPFNMFTLIVLGVKNVEQLPLTRHL